MSTQQEQRLHLREQPRAGGRTATVRWSATLATIRRRRIGPAAKQTALKGRAPIARVKPKPIGRGTGRLRRRERSERERALRASGGGAA